MFTSSRKELNHPEIKSTHMKQFESNDQRCPSVSGEKKIIRRLVIHKDGRDAISKKLSFWPQKSFSFFLITFEEKNDWLPGGQGIVAIICAKKRNAMKVNMDRYERTLLRRIALR